MLKFASFEAPSRYTFVDPDTQHLYSASDKGTLIENIVNYRCQNSLPPLEELGRVLDDYWCRLPENAGKCEEYKLNRGWFATWSGAVHLLKNVFYGSENMVGQEEADERSVVCKSCPNNVFPDRFLFIKWSDELAEASTGGRKSKEHTSLGNCAICSCPLRAKVFAKDMKMTEEQRKLAPDFCWAK